jgi:two-component system response regulator NreC
MKNRFNILIVENHPFMVDGYETMIANMGYLSDFDVHVEIARDCDQASASIKKASQVKKNRFHLMYLDIKLPASASGHLTSGEDIGAMARDMLPNTKIAVMTTYNEGYRIYNILKNVNPEGFFVKDDTDSRELIAAFYKIMNHPPYYSATVAKCVKAAKTYEVLDTIDRAILYHMSAGVKTKDLIRYVALSLPGVEKRKRALKHIFGIDGGSDEELIKRAKEEGFL